MDRIDAIGLVVNEFDKALAKHRGMQSYHEGISVIREEFEEAWDEVKKQKPDLEALKKEIAQLGAMALRFLVDLG
jgi:NTP pyrophosphatase (non-canonical NTP hydrolase)